MTEIELIQRIRQVEVEFAPEPPHGVEPVPDARSRIIARREAIEQTDPPMEHAYRFKDPVIRTLFTALLRRYGLVPYRYPQQPEADVMVQLSMDFESEVLMPLFNELKAEIARFHEASMQRVVGDAIHWDLSDAGQTVDDVPRTVRGS